MTDLHDRLAFFLATDALKDVQRANWTHAGARFENAAEHSWHASLLAMLFADAAPAGTDASHVQELLVVHDLVEVFAGDTPTYDEALLATEADREEAAGVRLMGLLPDDVHDRFDALWREFQAQETKEARFARAIDTLHPLVVSWGATGPAQALKTLTPTIILNRKRATIAAFPVLWALVLRLLQDAVDHGLLPPDDAIQRSDGADHAR